MRLDEFYGVFREYEDERKRAEELAAEISAMAKEAIEEKKDVEGLDGLFESASGMVREHPFLSPVFEKAFQSCCEARLFLSYLRDGSIDLPGDIDPRVCLEALKRLVRDMRRHFLVRMDRAEVDEARKAFEAMEDLLKTIERLDGIAEDLESMVEKSREELYDYKRKREDLDLDDVWFRK